MFEGQESLHTADGPTDYLLSAIVMSVLKSLVNFSPPKPILKSFTGKLNKSC